MGKEGQISTLNHVDDLDIQKIDSEVNDSDSGISSYDLLTYPADFTLEVLDNKWEKGEIIIPEFQRRYVWNINQASKLVESFLLGLPVPPIFLYTKKDSGKLLVVDGQQRLKSIVFYFKGTFGESGIQDKRTLFRLRLDEKSKWNGKTFEDLSKDDQEMLKACVLRAFIMKQIDPDDDSSITYVFERLNTGGTFLSNQDIRSCLFEGPLNTLLRELNNYPAWREIIGKSEPDKYSRDVELILRFFALFEESDGYSKPMKKFLSDFMKKYQSGQKNDYFRNIFTSTSDSICGKLGKKPFHILSGLNAAVFDSVFVAFGKSNNVPDDIQDRYKLLLKDETFSKSISSATTDVDTVKSRLNIASRILFS